MKFNRLIAFVLVLVMAFGLVACSSNHPAGSQEPEQSEAPADPSSEPSPTVSESVVSGSDLDPYPSEVLVSSDSNLTPYPPDPNVEKPSVNLAVLSGPTGVGAAKLLVDGIEGSTANAYAFRIATDNNELVAGLTNGEIDIATVASNVALNLYNKTDGDVKIIALGTLGVLHILEGSGGTSVNSMADLKGKTIYSAGQGANPEYILRYLLTQSGIDPDKDVEIIFADATEITQKLLNGDAEVAMLPVPAATTAILKSEGKIRSAIDVTEAWDEITDGSSLIMTAVVARTEFIENNKAVVDSFLAEYAASIDYANNNVDDAAELVAALGITANSAIAREAIPQCHLVCITGKDMGPAITEYFSILYKSNPASIGGALPDDAIYYVP